MTVTSIKNTLLTGDPLDPSDSDVIAQIGWLDVGKPVPDGWTVLSGNTRMSDVGRVTTRWDIQNPRDTL
jgi:hypothetical protein